MRLKRLVSFNSSSSILSSASKFSSSLKSRRSSKSSLRASLKMAAKVDKEWQEVTQLLEDIRDCKQIAGMLINGNYENLMTLLKNKSQTSIYHSSGLVLLRGVFAASYLDKKKFSHALKECATTLEMIQTKRKPNQGIFFTCDANCYTDLQVHAELMYSEMIAIHGALLVVSDTSITGFIRGALNVRSCYNGFKNCERIAAEKTNWKSQQLKEELIAGVKLGLGLFELAISFMPRKFILLLEMAGFSGNRSFGLHKLETCSKIKSSVHKLGGFGGIAGYYSFFEYFYGLGEANDQRPLLDFLIGEWRDMFPNSTWTSICQGFVHQMHGRFNDALTNYEKIMIDSRNPRYIHYGYYWQKCWLTAIQQDWQTAFECSKVLRKECSWSKSLFAYMYAVFGSMILEQGNNNYSQELKCDIFETLKQVPLLKRHFGGKKAFHEKLVIEKAKRFVDDPSKMILAPLDLIYLWNMFNVAGANRDVTQGLINLIEETMKKKEAISDVGVTCYLTFMKGVALARIGQVVQALEAFHFVIQSQSSLVEDLHLVPQSMFELGLIYRRAGDYDQATLWLKKTKKFSNFLTESMISFRSDLALKSMADAQTADLPADQCKH